MYQNPKRAKKLYKEIVPKAVDEYLDFIKREDPRPTTNFIEPCLACS